MFTASFLRTVSEIAQLSILVPLLMILIRFKRFGKPFITLSVLLVMASIISFMAYIHYAKEENNMYLLHIYTILEYIGWTFFYYQLFESKIIKKVLVVLIILFVLFSIANTIFWQPLEINNSHSRSLEGFLLVCFAVTWLYKVFVDSAIKNIEKHPVFWINTAVLIYFSGNFVLFTAQDLLLEITLKEFIVAWTLHGFFLILHYLLISLGIWLKKHRTAHH
ncbi:hypothetical protein [uncultured Kordia sp.]|uniref:hypothetical protein n=1 Tax=uncultured Kordia sp. TaxID=507699 RepID=UPI002633EBAE|nr:hypothetical protein [uncultured Kordia sp.]